MSNLYTIEIEWRWAENMVVPPPPALNNVEHSQLVHNYRNTKRLVMNKTLTFGAADI